MALIYRHIRLDNGMPFYIGIGKNHSRAFSKSNRGKHWNSVVKKYGYEVEIMLDDIDWETAIKKEKEFISLYGRKDNNTGILRNLTDGGDGLTAPSYDIKRKISETKKSNPTRYWLGKTRSEEDKKKMGLAKIGITHSDEHKRLNSQKIKDLWKDPIWREKMLLARKK